MNILLVQLQTSANPIMSMLPLLLMLLVIYFFFVRPTAKKQKEQTNFLNELKKGDEVVLGSGIVGRITKIEGVFVQLQTDQKTFLKVHKSAVSKEMTSTLSGGSANTSEV